MMPSRWFGAAILVRSVFMWLGVRAAVTFLGTPLVPGLHTPLVIALVAYLALHDTKLFNERTYLENLGVSPLTVLGLSTIPPASLEWAVSTIV